MCQNRGTEITKSKCSRVPHIQTTSALSLTVTLATWVQLPRRFYSFAKARSEKLSTCEGSGDVVLDLDVHKESRQSERHVALTAQADVMEACRA